MMTEARPTFGSRFRVLQVTHDLGVGGLPRVVTTLCSFIDRERFEVEVLCLNDLGPFAQELVAQGIPVRLLQQRGGKPDYFAFLKVATLLRRNRFDVVHTHNTQPFIDGGLGAWLAGVPTLVHTDHARDFPDKKRYMLAEHVMSRLAYKVVGVSEHTTANLRHYERIPERKLLTIPNGIDGRPYARPIDTRAKRAELGLANAGLVMTFAGRLTAQKGLIYLLEAMQQLLPRFENLRLMVAGEGSLTDELRKAGSDLGVATAVKFLGVRLDLPEILGISDVFVLPSVWEGLPMVLLEALAAGCPVVASAVGGVPAVIVHNENGLLVPPGDAAAIVREASRLLADSDLRRKLGTAGRIAFHRHHGAEVMARRYEALYRRSV